MTMDEHIECDRQLNEAEDKIKQLERKNHCAYSEGRNKGFEDGKRNADNLEKRIKELEEKLKEEYNRGIKDGLNQAADIVKNC